MHTRKVRILHNGQEFYLVDRGSGASSRTITLLKPLSETDEQKDGAVLVKTDVGPCVAAAQWDAGSVRIEKGFEALENEFGPIVDRYLEEFRVGRRQKNAIPFYFLSREMLPLFSLERSQPMGLAVLIFSTEEQAAEAARKHQSIDGHEVAVEKTENLPHFLEARATEGFAGAILDSRDPVYFCGDEANTFHFLKLALNESTGKIEYRLLEENGNWNPYDGEEELTVELDQEDLDQQMCERLGDTPFLGFFEGVPLSCLVRPDSPEEPISVDLSDAEAGDSEMVCPLFHDSELMTAFQTEYRLEDCTSVRVTDLMRIAKKCQEQRHLLVVHPGGHRARTAHLWVNDNEIILDSFSGIWRSRDGDSFLKD